MDEGTPHSHISCGTGIVLAGTSFARTKCALSLHPHSRVSLAPCAELLDELVGMVRRKDCWVQRWKKLITQTVEEVEDVGMEMAQPCVCVCPCLLVCVCVHMVCVGVRVNSFVACLSV